MNLLLRGDHLRQALAFDELHRIVVDATLCSDRVDRDDIGMVERGSGPGFVFEAGQLLLVEHRGERQHLERHAAAERDLLGFVNHAHAAPAQLAEDAKIAQHADDVSVFSPVGQPVRRKTVEHAPRPETLAG